MLSAICWQQWAGRAIGNWEEIAVAMPLSLSEIKMTFSLFEISKHLEIKVRNHFYQYSFLVGTKAQANRSILSLESRLQKIINIIGNWDFVWQASTAKEWRKL